LKLFFDRVIWLPYWNLKITTEEPHAEVEAMKELLDKEKEAHQNTLNILQRQTQTLREISNLASR
jgi:hypothetical protein